jgi:hypothetical protein
MQKTLSTQQLEAFYHDNFVTDQGRDFGAMTADLPLDGGCVVDVGGGCGYFARRVRDLTGRKVRVVDTDPASVQACHDAGIDAVVGDAVRLGPRGDEVVACFNLILHHLVADNEKDTRALQIAALRAWRNQARRVFVNEYIYESLVADLAGRMIYSITRSRLLSSMAGAIAHFVPVLRANTFGVGVRFRSRTGWIELFREAGYDVSDSHQGQPERVAPARRLLLIRAIRRDSFLLSPLP